MTATNLKAAPFVGLLVLAALLCGLGYSGWRLADAQERSRTRWVAVPGRVVATSIEVDEEHDEYHSIYHYPRLTYSYQFAGRDLVGRRFRVVDDRSFSTRAEAERVLEKLPVGGAITVLVDPDDPSMAVLQLDGSSMPYLLCLVAALFLAVPVLAMLLRLRPALRSFGLLLLVVAWYAVLVWAVPHWWRNCDPPGLARVFVWAVFLGYAALGGLLGLMGIGSLRRRAGS
ncbi:MAG: DUF3592 domain-containing protein [Planctomycetes bacterium]|nr:DUF3592 domain-containing protein [Planctomycetota bacterium]